MSDQHSSKPSSLLRLDASSLKRIIVLFWALYFSVVVASNLCDGLKALDVLPSDWAFASGNYPLIVQVVAIYSIPGEVAGIFFALIVLWETFIASLFWRLFRNPGALEAPGRPLAVRAFGAGIVLWIIFILSDELFIAYDKFGGLEGAHVAMLSAQAITFLVVYFVNREGLDLSAQ